MTESPFPLDPADVPFTAWSRTLDALRRGVEDGLHHGGQLYVARDGQVLADFAFGLRRQDQPMTRDSRMIWLSSTKPVAAVAIAQLWERGELELDDPVTRFLPEFGQKGKEAITLRHILTHTGGFRMLGLPWPKASWEELIERICATKIEPRWVPGERAGYHQQGSWFILGEVIRRIDGRPFERYSREALFEPLGMDDCWVGMPAEIFREDPDRIAPLYDTAVQNGDGSPGSEPGWRPFPMHREDRMTHANPAASGAGPMHQLARLYHMLLGRGELDGQRLLLPQTVEALTCPHRVGLYDRTFKAPMDWGLGLIVNSEHYHEDDDPATADGSDGPDEARMPYGYGRYASRRTFGHSGRQSSAAFADPVQRLVIALAVNGLPGDEPHRARTQAITEGIYEDLGLTP